MKVYRKMKLVLKCNRIETYSDGNIYAKNIGIIFRYDSQKSIFGKLWESIKEPDKGSFFVTDEKTELKRSKLVEHVILFRG